MPDLERRLRADLDGLGFHEDDIDHIEIGRDCGRELRQLSRMAHLNARREDLLFQLANAKENHDAAHLRAEFVSNAVLQKHVRAVKRLNEALEKVAAATNAARSELHRLRSVCHEDGDARAVKRLGHLVDGRVKRRLVLAAALD